MLKQELSTHTLADQNAISKKKERLQGRGTITKMVQSARQSLQKQHHSGWGEAQSVQKIK